MAPEYRKLCKLPCYLSIAVFTMGFTLIVPWVDAEDNNLSSAQRQIIMPPPQEGPNQVTTAPQIEAAVRADRKEAANIVSRALNSEQPATITFAGQAVAASIRGLGKKITPMAMGRIVLAAVEMRSAAVLQILRVAVSQTGKKMHLEIVAAAASGIAAVADPYMAITVIKVESGALGYEPYQAGSAQGTAESVAGIQFDQGATLAEDIVQVALQSGSNESLAVLSRVANAVLQRQASPDSFASQGQLPTVPPGVVATPTPATLTPARIFARPVSVAAPLATPPPFSIIPEPVSP
jgi:hypothetical protein